MKSKKLKLGVDFTLNEDHTIFTLVNGDILLEIQLYEKIGGKIFFYVSRNNHGLKGQGETYTLSPIRGEHRTTVKMDYGKLGVFARLRFRISRSMLKLGKRKKKEKTMEDRL